MSARKISAVVHGSSWQGIQMRYAYLMQILIILFITVHSFKRLKTDSFYCSSEQQPTYG